MVIHPADGLIHRLLRQSGQAQASSAEAPKASARRDQVSISNDARAQLAEERAGERMAGERGGAGVQAETGADRLGEQLLLQTYKRSGRRG